MVRQDLKKYKNIYYSNQINVMELNMSEEKKDKTNRAKGGRRFVD